MAPPPSSSTCPPATAQSSRADIRRPRGSGEGVAGVGVRAASYRLGIGPAAWQPAAEHSGRVSAVHRLSVHFWGVIWARTTSSCGGRRSRCHFRVGILLHVRGSLRQLNPKHVFIAPLIGLANLGTFGAHSSTAVARDENRRVVSAGLWDGEVIQLDEIVRRGAISCDRPTLATSAFSRATRATRRGRRRRPPS